MDLRRESVAELARRVARREVSAREVTEAALARIDAVDGAINAFVAVDPEGAVRQAIAIDERLARGEPVGVLAGVPIGVKDLEDAAGFVTSHGSFAFAGGPPAPRDSIVVARLRQAGCVVLGKTNTSELGWKGDTENPVFGGTSNPWRPGRSAGGSSGGSAAAVAAGMALLATGSDGGGSIRIPSALCGLSGLKPSLGRVPTGDPAPPGWAELSTRGVLGRRIRDVVAGLEAVVGPDPNDLRSLPLPSVRWSASLDDLNPPLRVGWTPNLGYAEVDHEVRTACERAVAALDALGSEVVPLDAVFAEDPLDHYLTLTRSYLWRSLQPFEGTEVWDRLESALAAQVDHARHLTALDLVRAQDATHLLNLQLVSVFQRVSLLLCPTVAGQAPPVGGLGSINGREDPNWVRLTYPFNLTRSPAGTVCVGFTADGIPIGLQVVGPQHGDVAVLRLVALLEDALGLDTVAPVAG